WTQSHRQHHALCQCERCGSLRRGFEPVHADGTMKRRRRKSTARRKFRSRLLACIRRHNGKWVTIAKIACDFHPNHRDVRIAGTLKQLIAEGKVEEHARLAPAFRTLFPPCEETR